MADRGGRRRFTSTTVEVEGREEVRVVELPAIEPPPWDDDATLTVVGTSPKRADALEKVTGSARYTTDQCLPGMLHAAFVRAPVAHGRITRLDLDAVRGAHGVVDIVTRDGIPGIKVDGIALLDPEIHYAGQPVAVIVADSASAARNAAKTVAATLAVETLPHAVTAEAALAKDAPRVRKHGNLGRNSPRTTVRGDIDGGRATADVVIEREYRTPVALHAALEPHSAVAEWTGDRVTIWESTQGVFNTRADLADALGVPASHVRVVCEYMGGGFGAKNGASHVTYMAALLARRTGRPVRCVLDREEELTDAANRPASIQRVTLGARRDGTLTLIDLDAVVPLGVGGWQSSAGRIFRELYRCPNVRTTETFVFTNTPAMGSFRAPGSVEGAFALESAMDALAEALGLDPLELRVRNHADLDQEKERRYSSKRLLDCYREGAARAGWSERRARPRSSERVRTGVGMASLVWGAGGGPPAYATVRLNPDGSVEVLTGSQDLGTGSRTVLAQVAAEALGASASDVRTTLGDTERLPYAPNSWGSITTASVGPAVRVAAIEARSALLDAAGAMLDASPDTLEVRDSVVRAPDGKSLSFAEIGERLGDVMIQGHGSRGPNPDETTIAAFGAQFAEVEVDTETGVVRVLRVVSVHDSGRIVNPTLARSQLEGGIIQGLGFALFEERILDQRLGVQLNPTMHDYKVPTMVDVPVIDASWVEHADPVANHTGVKGLAEPPIIGVAPAIANAVRHATGVELAELPMTPWRVLSALVGDPGEA